ncbi:MAG: hypothetical protein ACJARY_002481 [Candidatus Azotimanducaceae bacterium]|jgi:hypothetical protein
MQKFRTARPPQPRRNAKDNRGSVDIVDARLMAFAPTQKFSFMVSRYDEFGIESDHIHSGTLR